MFSPRQAPRQTQQATSQQLTHPVQQGNKSSAALQTLPKQQQKQQQETRGSLLQAQPRQQQRQEQVKQGPLLQAQPRQQQGQEHGDLKADHSAGPTAAEPMSLIRHRAAALGPNAQPAGLHQGRGISAEAGPDMPFSQQSHVSASPSTSKSESERQANSQQQHGPKVVVTLADSAPQSSLETQASQGCSKPATDHPVLHESSRSATIAAGAGHQGRLQANGIAAEPQDWETGGQLTSSGAVPAALEPAGPDADACSGGDDLPACSDKSMQLPEQMPKHAACAPKAGLQKCKSTAHVPGNTAVGQNSKLQKTAGRAAWQKSRTTSRAASAAPAESQQSAVHAALLVPPQQSMPVKGLPSLKRGMPAAQGHTPSDVRTASSKAKRSRAEVIIGPAGLKDAEQSRKRSRPHSNSMPPTHNTSQPGRQKHDTGSAQTLSSDGCDLRHRDGGLREADEMECPRMCPPRAPQGQIRLAESSSMELRPNGCEGTGQSAKRPSRKRDSDASKPWWVV